MKSLLKMLVLMLGIGHVLISPATLPVFDLAAYLRLGTELTQLEQQTAYLQTQLNALKPLSAGQYQWSNVVPLLNQLGTTISNTQGIAYNAENLEAQFKQLFPGYVAPTHYPQQYQQMIDTTQNTLNGTLQSMGGNAKDFADEQQRLQFLAQQSQSAVGQTQAIQAASQIAAEQVSQIQLLRQTVMAQTNAQATYYATQIQQEAQAQAEFSQVIAAGNTTVPAYGTSGNSLNPPHF